MRYQFLVDGREAAPVRQTWREAAQDAVSSGYAVWAWWGGVRLDPQAAISRSDEPSVRRGKHE